MALRLGDIAPDFTADTTAAQLIFMNGSVKLGRARWVQQACE